ncbi:MULTISPECIES: hypothetical protein [unclassified Enterococcus]|jgi:hypothetical protein|nr:hypothetical protein D920_02704 [Enterococcus faecalis 13-SD-W-01]
MQILLIFSLLSIITVLGYTAIRSIQLEPQPVKARVKSETNRK